MDLDSLEIFCAVVREGGVIRAAEKLHRVQSNVTTRVKQLERALEVDLFRRQGRTLKLTAAGETLLVHAEKLLRLADEAQAAVRGQRLAGSFLLGAMQSTAAARLPPMLSRFSRLHPQVALSLQTGTGADLIRQVQVYQLDAALVGEPFMAEGLSAQRVFEEELVLIGTESQVPARGRLALSSLTFLAFAEGCSYRRRLLDWLASEDVVPAKLVTLGSYHAIMACAAGGMGVGVVPRSLLGTLRDTGYLSVRPLPKRWRASHTHLVWRDMHPLLPQMQALMRMGSGTSPAEPDVRVVDPRTPPAGAVRPSRMAVDGQRGAFIAGAAAHRKPR
jgi:DNA-binding transcriptional LysR family regulator